MKKEEFLYSLKTAFKEYYSVAIGKIGFALLCGATAGIVVSICIPKLTVNPISIRNKTEIGTSERDLIELAAIKKYCDELKTSPEKYTELLNMLRANVRNNPSRYQGIVEDTQKRIKELEEEIGILYRNPLLNYDSQ